MAKRVILLFIQNFSNSHTVNVERTNGVFKCIHETCQYETSIPRNLFMHWKRTCSMKTTLTDDIDSNSLQSPELEGENESESQLVENHTTENSDDVQVIETRANINSQVYKVPKSFERLLSKFVGRQPT